MFELGGRKWQIITNGSLQHDYWMVEQVRDAGIKDVEIPAGADLDQALNALIARVMAKGAFLTLLGGLLIPAEIPVTDWTPDVAAEVSAFIGKLVAEEDKVRVRALVAQMLAGFFRSGLVSGWTSPISSAPSPVAHAAAEIGAKTAQHSAE